MKTKHTPGPWYVSGSNIHDRETRFDEHGARQGETPNNICFTCWTPTGEQSSNLNLIASAPEMLEALQAAEHELDRLSYITDEVDREPTEAVLQLIQAVIEKAKGQP